VLDIQECPAADLGLAALACATLEALTAERWSSLAEQQAFATYDLSRIFLDCIRDAGPGRAGRPPLPGRPLACPEYRA
jgi:hypothetical protein